MKKLLLGLMFVGQLMADETHGWALVYTQKVVDPTRSYAMYCPQDPGCNTVYRDKEVTEWYPTRELAVKRMNGVFTRDSETVWINGTGGSFAPWVIKPEDFVGLFRAERSEIKQKQTGMHKESVTRQDEVDVPTMEWQP